MIGFLSSFLAILAGTFAALYSGLLLIFVLRRISSQYLAAFGLGVTFWYFVDTMNDAAQLGVNKGFSGGVHQLGLVLLFVVGLSLVIFGRSFPQQFASELSPKSLSVVPFLVALAIGFHSVGEGISFGALASTTQSSSLIEALGGYGQGTAYVLHKLLEGTVVAISYRVYVQGGGQSRISALKRNASLGLVAGIPTLLGEGVGYYLPLETTYFFALAAGAAIYIFLRLVPPVLLQSKHPTSYASSIKIAASLFLGFVSLYLAGLFHAP